MNTSTLPFFRFFAVLVVVFYHYGKETEYYELLPQVVKAGPQMVTFFFVLSGFVLFLGYQIKDNFNFRQYFTKRAIRILPLYFIALSMTVLIKVRSGQVDLAELFFNVLCLQSWFPPYPTSLNYPGWFVCNLLFFYLFFPLIVFFLKEAKPNRIKILLASLFLWAFTQSILIKLLNSNFYSGYPSFSHDLIYYFPLSHFCSFFIGICGAYFIQTKGDIHQLSKVKTLIFTVLTFCSVFFIIQYQSEIVKIVGIKLPFGASFYAPFFLLLIFSITLPHNSILEIFSLRIFTFLGGVSYAIYIMQSPVYSLYKFFISKNIKIQPELDFTFFLMVLVFAAILVTFFEKLIISRIKIYSEMLYQ